MRTRPLCFALLLAGLHCDANAQFFKCKDVSGRVTIQDVPCPAEPGAPERKRPIPGQKNESLTQRNKGSGSGANWDTGPKAATSAEPSQARSDAEPDDIPGLEDRMQRIRELTERQAAIKAKSAATPPTCKLARQQLELLKSTKPSSAAGSGEGMNKLLEEGRPGLIAIAEQNVARCVDK